MSRPHQNHLRDRVEELVGDVDDSVWHAVSGWLRLARSRFERVPLDGSAVRRECANCGSGFNPFNVPCACIYCRSCWVRIARRFDLPIVMACQLGSACPTGAAQERLRQVQLVVGRAAGFGAVAPTTQVKRCRRGRHVLDFDDLLALEADWIDRPERT